MRRCSSNSSVAGATISGSFPGLRWIVDAEHVPPPADAFFEMTLRVDPLDPESAMDLVARRLDAGGGRDREIVDRLRAWAPELVAQGDGIPRHLLGRLRTAAVESPARASAVAEIVASAGQFGETAERLAQLLAGTDQPLSASDEDLIDALGVSRGRLAQEFQQLEKRGLVEGRSLPADGPGRPRTGYQLAAQFPRNQV